jgi:hypothetical protein
MSLVFAVAGPSSAGAAWLLSFNDFWDGANTFAVALFSFGPAWILGLILAIKALDRIETGQGTLIGKEYALAGAYISAVWMVLIVVALVFPAIFYVNS